MLDKFGKIEEKVNQGILKLVELIGILLVKISPRPVLEKYRAFSHWVRQVIYNAKANFSNFFINFVLNAKDFLVDIKLKKKALLAKREDVKVAMNKVKLFLLSSPIKTTMGYIKEVWAKLKTKIDPLFNKEKAPQYIMFGTAFGMITLSLIFIGQQSHNIYRSENPYREPASVQIYDDKPEYYYYKQQTTSVQNIKVPLQVLGVEKMSSLTIDFTVRTSTRYASYFLSENEHKLKDYFFTNVEPIVSDFALDEDGKEVLKEKIQREIQTFLDKQKVEGKVLEVNLQYVIGS